MGSGTPKAGATAEQVARTLAWLERHGSERNRAGMARYGIRSPKRYGVPMGAMRDLTRRLGHDHALALALWRTGWHEARLLAGLVDEPARVTSDQMERWLLAFDNWALCDSTCLHLFDRTAHAWRKVRAWARREGEFEKRAAFALLAGLASHDRGAPDAAFLAMLPLVVRAASDERNLVKKAVSWALRGIGKRNLALNAEALRTARALAGARVSAARWVGRDALRELASPAVQHRLARRIVTRRRVRGAAK